MPQSSTLSIADVIVPDWPAPANVHALFTTRAGGVSSGSYASLNLGAHVSDSPEGVAENRRRLGTLMPRAPAWLRQVHGTAVARMEDVFAAGRDIDADAAFTANANTPCAVLIADCLPVLFTDVDGSVVAAAHAGWRGLSAGVLEASVAAMKIAPDNIMAWLGPAIGARAFEVGAEVREAFLAGAGSDREAIVQAFVARGTAHPGKYFADIYALARARLAGVGVRSIYGGNYCTVTDRERFFSYRRDGKTGRMAAAIWRT